MVHHRYIIAPNVMHHFFLKQYKDYFPNAKVIGPKALNRKKALEGWQLHEGARVRFGGFVNDRTMFHQSSKTNRPRRSMALRMRYVASRMHGIFRPQ